MKQTIKNIIEKNKKFFIFLCCFIFILIFLSIIINLVLWNISRSDINNNKVNPYYIKKIKVEMASYSEIDYTLYNYEEIEKSLNDLEIALFSYEHSLDDTITKRFYKNVFDVYDKKLDDIVHIIQKKLSIRRQSLLSADIDSFKIEREKNAKKYSYRYNDIKAEEIDFYKRLYELTKQKCFDLINDYKGYLNG
ncbi:MAG: hypothetical protein Q4F88_05455 [Eubacteriales bacterium]|nr:hypothetical protein [Eubacteriales bacterium]